MGIPTAAGTIYALIVFLTGFAFGTLRVLVLAARLGETGAVSLETLVMLAASWSAVRAWIGSMCRARLLPDP